MVVRDSDFLDVSGRVYLVAGAAGGLAAPLVRALLERQARLVLMDTNFKALEALTSGIPETVALKGDITDKRMNERAVTLARDTFGRIDGG